MNNNFIILQVLVYFTILFLWYRLVFHKKQNGFIKFVKFRMVPLTLIGGWIIYFIGYHFLKDEEIVSSAFLALFSTVRLFILGNDLIELNGYLEGQETFLLWFSVMGASAAFISASILLNMFGKKITTQIKFWLNRSEEIFIFFGVNSASLALAKDLLKNNKSRLVIFVQKMKKNEDVALVHEAEEAGVLLVSMESLLDSLHLEKEESIIHAPEEENDNLEHINENIDQLLKKLRLTKKILSCTTHLFFLSNKEEWNLSRARIVIDELNALSSNKTATVHIRTSSPGLECVFQSSLKNLSQKVKVAFINLSEIASRQMISDNEPVNWIDIDTEKAVAKSDFTVLVAGFGQTGSAALKKLIELGQFEGSNFKAFVIDKNIQSRKGRFEMNYPGTSNYSIDFRETEIGREEFFRLIKEQMNNLNYIVLAMGDDEHNIQTAVDIQQFLLKHCNRKIRIIAQVKDNDNYNLLFDQSQQISISIFGRGKDIFTENIIVRGELEKRAERIHDYYNLKKDDIQQRKSWSDIRGIKYLSNISTANHLHTKLVLAGLTVEKVHQFTSAEEFEFYLGKERLENLAKTEHLRWNALYYSNGWDTLDLMDISEDATSNQDEEKKLHSCLVDWKDLTVISERFNEDYYGYDKENVINIFELIRDGIYTEN